jgi:Zn-dependent protease with chaperone function
METILQILLILVIIRILLSFLKNSSLRYIRKRVRKLYPEKQFKVELIKENIFNAYASFEMPDTEKITVFSGSLSVLTKKELDFVLAHEIAHHVKGHIRSKQKRVSIAGNFLEKIRPKGFLESIGFSSLKKETPFWWDVLDAGKDLVFSQFDQKEEFEADAFAVTL